MPVLATGPTSGHGMEILLFFNKTSPPFLHAYVIEIPTNLPNKPEIGLS
jgi:hypothetical protein